MKKSVSAALALCLLLSLASCSQLLGEALKEPDEPSPPPVQTPEGGDKPEPTEPELEPEPTGVDEYGFTLWPEGNYLADKKFDTDEYLPDYDVDNSMRAPGIIANVCSTSESVYAASYNIKGGMYYSFVAYADKSTGIVAPLCGRPECTHMDEDCNAYTGAHAYGLRVYDGKLWWVTNVMFKAEPELRCMELDGTKHETVLTLERGSNVYNNYFIHRGYIYFSEIAESIVDGETGFAFRVMAYSMDDGRLITILDQSHEGKVNVQGARNLTVIPVGNDLIILLSWKEKQDDGETADSTRIYRWSSKTRQVEQLYSAENGEWNYSTYPYGEAYPAREEGLYFIKGAETDGSRSDYTLMLFSFKTGEFEEVSSFSVLDGGSVTITRDYIAVYGSNQAGEYCLLIYDYDGNLLSVSDPIRDYTSTGSSKIGGDEDYFYIQYGLHWETGIKAGVLAIPVHGGEMLDIK